MTLQALRQVRLQGGKPSSLVKVVVGKRVPALESQPDLITVTDSDRPALMDWRPVVGLPVVLFVCRGADLLGEAVLDALVPAGCRLEGAAWWDATVSTDEETKPVLHRMWDLLCT
jgi:hypothetical protein